MPIHLNGSPNPESVVFNGAALSRVWASVDGGQSTRVVWNAQSAFPSTLSQITATKGSGVEIWIRDSTLLRAWREIWASDGSLHAFAEYECDITLDVSYPSQEFVGAAYGGTANIQWGPSTSTGRTSLSGLPSGYSFYSLMPSDSMNLDFYKTVDGSQSQIERRIGIDCMFSINPTLFFVLGDSGIIGNYYLYTATSGFVYQGPAVLRIEKTRL